MLEDKFEPQRRVLSCPNHGVQYLLKPVGCDVDFSEHMPWATQTLSNLEEMVEVYGRAIQSGALVFRQKPVSVMFLGALETKPLSRVRIKALVWEPFQS